jgi:hypothetical protein
VVFAVAVLVSLAKSGVLSSRVGPPGEVSGSAG